MAKVAIVAVLLSTTLVCGREIRVTKTENQTESAELIQKEIFDLSSRVYNLSKNAKTSAKRDNFVFSPVGLGLGLGQLHLAANDELRVLIEDQLMNWKFGELNLHRNLSFIQTKLSAQEVQEIPQSESSKGDKDIDIILQTAVFYQSHVLLHENYKERAADYYKTQFVPLKSNISLSEKQSLINSWVQKGTKGLIKEFQAPSNFLVLMANTICFEGDWELPFAEEYSKQGSFSLDGKEEVEVMYMRGQEEVPYYENKDLDYKIIRMPYKSRDLEKKNVSMYVISPVGHNLEEVMDSLSFEELKTIIKEGMPIRPVNIKLPKVEINRRINVKSIMDKLMLQQKTHRRWERDVKPKLANVYQYELSEGSNDKDFVLSSFVQETVLNVFELGTSAASITGGYINYDGSAKRLLADKPYLMLIYDDINDLVLFYGAIFNPSSTNSTPLKRRQF